MTSVPPPPPNEQPAFAQLLLDHYLPLWVAIFLAVLPILIGNLIHSGVQSVKEQGGVKWAADVNLGLLSFWLWALVTNAHDGRLVRTSGQHPATDERQKRLEFTMILFFTALTICFYLICNMMIPPMLGFLLTALSLTFPPFVLGLPE